MLTFNSEKNIRNALESVSRCKEIIVIDGGSTDKTCEIAREYGAKIIPQRTEDQQGTELTNFAEARNKGLKHTGEPWILALDSDEWASPKLISEISTISLTEQKPTAYLVPRRYILSDGTIVQHATTYPNERIYFFHRDCIEKWIKPVHERVELKPSIPTHKLTGASLAPLGSLENYREKNLRYLEVERKRSQGKGWIHWLKNRLLHTLRSRAIAFIRLCWIWLIPHRGKKLPLRHELLRFWYGWKLIVVTCPLRKSR
jgi:glycosyltransferase involved in cell wall biosynthesis